MRMITATTEFRQPRAGIASLALLIALYLGLPAWLPVQAQEPANSAEATLPPAQKSSEPMTDSTKSFIGHFPKSLLSFAAGTAIGTPIALVRCTKRELVKQTKEAYSLGGVSKPLGWITAGFFGLSSGVLFGVGLGISDGLADSWVNSGDAPFSGKSFSLDDLVF